jgi:phosphonate transport system substrate-binding protein
MLALPLQAAAEDSYLLGIFPYMAPRQIAELFGPITADLEATLKHRVRLESTVTFPDFNKALEDQKYDIALIQPFDYPKVVKEYGYLPLVQFDGKLETQFMVRDDSSYQVLNDLRGKTIGMPPRETANARMALRELHINKLVPERDVTLKYFNSHISCLQHLWIGEVSACPSTGSLISTFEQRMQAKLRSILITEGIPPPLFVIHPRVSMGERIKLQQLMTGWNLSENGLALLKALNFPGLVIPDPSEYLKMKKYDSGTPNAKEIPSR